VRPRLEEISQCSPASSLASAFGDRCCQTMTPLDRLSKNSRPPCDSEPGCSVPKEGQQSYTLRERERGGVEMSVPCSLSVAMADGGG
jgi:hypothetical protein